MATLLSREHPITERPKLDFQPYGKTPQGLTIRDLSGVVIRANVEHLEDLVSRQHGAQSGREAVKELIRLLNGRIPDHAFRVTEDFLKSPWNSYSNEFSAFVGQFCVQLSGDPDFHFTMAQDKAISSIILALARPLTVSQIYRLSTYFAQRYSRNSFEVEPVRMAHEWALLRLRFTSHAYQQFGPFRLACAKLWCNAVRGYFYAVPAKCHAAPPAHVVERSCIAQGDEFCEWEVSWTAERSRGRRWAVLTGLLNMPSKSPRQDPAAIIEEQARSLDAWHHELQNAYVHQQQLTATLQRRVDELTLLHEISVVFTSTLNRETLLTRVPEALLEKLNYDAAFLFFFDADRKMAYDARLFGIAEESAAEAQKLEVPIADSTTVEGRILLTGESVLLSDIESLDGLLHPPYQPFVEMTNAKSLLGVPLKVGDRVIAVLIAERAHDEPMNREDLDLLTTVAAQLAMALDNAQAYQQIEALNIGLEAKVKERTAALQQFLAKVSHDLRTPLTSITGFTENMLSGFVGEVSEKQRQYLQRVLANSLRLRRLVDELLAMLLDRENAPLFLKEVEIATLTLEVVEELRPLAAAKRQRLEVSGAEVSAIVRGDPDKLTRILTNLVDNAIKYTPREGTITITIERIGDRQPQARITVQDSGPGIPAEILPKIFDHAFHLSQPQKTGVASHGLGLSIVKDLVDRHGGSIDVQSEVGTGSIFTVSLPLCRETVPPIAGRAAKHLRKHILVADDDPDIRQMLADRLTSCGYDVRTVTNGEEALGAMEAAHFDGLLLDIGMPGLSGLEVLDRVRGHRIPIIMMTATEARERAVTALHAGAQAYLLKPFDAGQLQDVVERWIGPA